uniref:ST8 alpha-N-acetyl-neuraminide alpha-2,8-sialyltransferase 6 n=1 Tax=Varanus komodoensis TaxID=61221 RepID=A0A8D2IN65_VARKO
VSHWGNFLHSSKPLLEEKTIFPREILTPFPSLCRAELRRCCNASSSLVLTKENAPLGSSIIFDGNKNRKLSVDAVLFDLLPKRLPFSDTHYGHCAVVGNGGILRNSHCGHEIDQADLVVRFNMAPMNFSEDVGTKTSLITINPSILQFKNLQARRKPFADALRPYRDALFLIPAFSFVGHSTLSYRALYTMEDFGWPQQMFFLNPHYLATLSNHWKEKGFHPQRLSSGFMFVNVALEFCERITLYGFWPFAHDLDDQPIPHHYYDNMLPKAGIHAMPSEFSHYLSIRTFCPAPQT